MLCQTTAIVQAGKHLKAIISLLLLMLNGVCTLLLGLEDVFSSKSIGIQSYFISKKISTR